MEPVKLFPKLQKPTLDGQDTWDGVLRQITGGYSICITEKDGHHILVGPKVTYGDTWIPEATSQPVIHPHLAILHTNAGPKKTPWKNLYYHIMRKDVVGEMHFQVAMDGTVANLMPLNRRADCNYSANSFRLPNRGTQLFGAISFETQDEGWPTLNTTPWTTQQLNAMIAALVCLCVCYGMTCNSPVSWNGSGIGYHSQYPYQGTFYPAWTNVRGKTCPGTARKLQMDYIRNQVADRLAAFGAETGWKCGT